MKALRTGDAAIRWLVLLGIGLRTWHYLCCPTIWYDEAALVVNVLDKGFAALLGPLAFSEAAPPLFLWIERAMGLTFGDGLYVLRCVPFAASCAAMLLMAGLARRLLRPAAAPWAVFLFAVSDRLLWHCCEAKPYAVEILAAMVLLYLFDLLRGRSVVLQTLLFAALAPVVIALCYPGCFLYGGLLLALLPAVWQERRRPVVWLSYALMAAAVLAAFGLLLIGPIRAQRDPRLVACWYDLDKFPRWDQVWTVPWWLLRSTLEIFDYSCRPVGFLLAPLAVVGATCFWRRGRRDLLLVMLVPMLLPLAAACFAAFPYGGVRVLAYLTPALILLIAEGVPPAWVWLRARNRWLLLPLLAALLAPAGRAAWRTIIPWRRADTTSAAAYVLQERQPNEPVTGFDCSYCYLFRQQTPGFTPLDDFQPPGAGRVWVLVTLDSDHDQQRVLRRFPADEWESSPCRDFTQVRVLLLQRRTPPRDPAAAAS